MAITASTALSLSTVTAEQQLTATLTVNNSIATAYQVLSIQPLCTPASGSTQTASWSPGVVMLGGNFPSTVPASGSANFSFGLTVHAPTSPNGLQYSGTAGQYQYNVAAIIVTSDGSVTTATAATLTVNNPALK